MQCEGTRLTSMAALDYSDGIYARTGTSVSTQLSCHRQKKLTAIKSLMFLQSIDLIMRITNCYQWKCAKMKKKMVQKFMEVANRWELEEKILFRCVPPCSSLQQWNSMSNSVY